MMKNRVLFTAILILSYGIYVPKGWRLRHLGRRATRCLAVRNFTSALSPTSRGPGLAGASRLGEWNNTACASASMP